jgi:hypothetical protein
MCSPGFNQAFAFKCATCTATPRQVKKRFTGEDALTPAERKDKEAEGIRLSKALAQLGVASRRASEEIIFAGRVHGRVGTFHHVVFVHRSGQHKGVHMADVHRRRRRQGYP